MADADRHTLAKRARTEASDQPSCDEPPAKRTRPDTLSISATNTSLVIRSDTPPSQEPTFQQMWDAFAALERAEAEAEAKITKDDIDNADAEMPNPEHSEPDAEMPNPEHSEPDAEHFAMSVPDVLPESTLANTFEKHVMGLLSVVRAPFDVEPMGARLGYLASLLAELEAAGCCGVGTDVRSRASKDPRSLMLFFEAATQAQVRCQLWSLLRKGLTTASTMRWGPKGPQIPTHWLTSTDRSIYESPAIVFGRTNEATARTILFHYLVRRDDAQTGSDRFIFHTPRDLGEENVHSCGVLIDAHTGMLGASLDILVCPRDASGRLSPRPNTPMRFYEVKCRAKYAFDPTASDPLASAYAVLMAERSPEAFRTFLRSTRNPCVRHFPEDGVPGPEEALVSSNSSWLSGAPTRERRRCTKMERALLNLNRTVTSRVLLFGAPDVCRRTISPVPWSSGNIIHHEPVFANPRHTNFKQIFVQAYVLNSHFPDRQLLPHLVTFIGRRRAPAEEGVSFALGSARVDSGAVKVPPVPASVLPDQAIPIALILTPVLLDPSEFRTLQCCSRLAFNDTLTRVWASLSRVGGAAASETS
ncbi:hypothetical protein AMR77_25420 [Escherichia coli]|nr:hypothetical protein AMR77_25420 [Escherichia coli]